MRSILMAALAVCILTPACGAAPQDGAESAAAGATQELPPSYSTLAFDGPGDVPFTLGGPWIIVDGVMVNDTGPYRFMFDTGAAGGGRIDVTLAEKLGLEPVDEIQASDGSGRGGPIMPVYALERLSFGPLDFENVQVLSRDYNAPGAVAVRGGPIDGILGMQLFEELLLTIDYPNNELRVSEGALPDPDGQTVFAYDESSPVPIVPVTLAGETFPAHIDTGNQGGVTVGGAPAERLPYKGERRAIGQARTVSGAFDIESATLDGALEIGSFRLQDPEIVIAPPFPNLNLGGQFLNRFSISIDQINSRVRLEEGEAAAPEPTRVAVAAAPSSDQPRRRYGIGMAPPQGGEEFLTVLAVPEGNVAAEAGLQVNDRILSVNGTAVPELTPDAFGAAMRGSPLTLVIDRDGETLTFEMALDGSAPRVTGGGERPAPAPMDGDADFSDAALELADLLAARYLFPDVGAQYADTLRGFAADGRYGALASPGAFASRVTADLADVSRDNHLRVLASTGRPAGLDAAGDAPEDFGVRESGWLADKVAFMRLGLMPDSQAAQDWADAFMREHAEAEALILDVRACPGGALSLMNGFLPYLYDEPTHLLTMDMRPGADEETEDWLDETPELRRVETDGSVLRWEHWIEPADGAKPDMPVYVLTDMTASACEHLTDALKVTDRATVIGAPTRGAGHFVAFHDFGDGFSVILPVGRTYDPETGEDWEGDGIAPDVAIAPAEAEAEALRRIAENER